MAINEKFAQIKDGTIRNIIACNSLQNAELISDPSYIVKRIDNLPVVPHIGWEYDEETDTFSEAQYIPTEADIMASIVDNAKFGISFFAKIGSDKILQGVSIADLAQLSIDTSPIAIQLAIGCPEAALILLSQFNPVTNFSDEDIIKYGNLLRAQVGLGSVSSKSDLAVFS